MTFTQQEYEGKRIRRYTNGYVVIGAMDWYGLNHMTSGEANYTEAGYKIYKLADKETVYMATKGKYEQKS